MSENQEPSRKRAFKLFALGASRKLGQDLGQLLEVELEELHEEVFPDGEICLKPLQEVKGFNVVLLHCLSFDELKGPNEKISEVLLFLSLLKDLGACEITLVLPYLAYSRSDQRKDLQDPLTLKYWARLYESAGADRVLTLDVHNIAAFENAFRCPCLNMEALPLFVNEIEKTPNLEPLVLMSPDLGGIKRVEKFRRVLQSTLKHSVSMAFLEKYREQTGLTGTTVVGDLKGAHVVIYDDMISTGKTVLRAADAVRTAGALSLRVMATHGLFSENKEGLLNSPLIDEVIVTNSNPALESSPFQSFQKLKVLSCGGLLAQGLRL